MSAVGLSARRELDWAELTGQPQLPWLRPVLLGLSLILLMLGVRNAVLAVRRKAPPQLQEEEEPGEGRRLGWAAHLMLAAAVVAALGVVFWLVGVLVVEGPPEDATPRLDRARDGASGVAAGSPLAPVLGALVAAALAALLLWRNHRSRRGQGLLAEDDPEAAADDLEAAVGAAQDALSVSPGEDTRSAIIAAYRGMERSLSRSGAPSRASDTPTEVLMLAVETRLRAEPARSAAFRLTELFREARFSTHELPAERRDEADHALAQISTRLGSRRG